MDESPFENTNTAGTIISPARKATPVSKISTCVTDFSRSAFFGIYDPNVIIIPIARDIE